MQNLNNQFPTTGLVRLPQILAVYPVSRSTWWAGVKSGRYPKSVKLGPHTTAWWAVDILDLMQREAGVHNTTSHIKMM
ncbi:MAG: AlpA family phage regulatory protein [Nitrosospira sp.]|nr:AlpA family phage regulatory protein [Nitrosospira sp.]